MPGGTVRKLWHILISRRWLSGRENKKTTLMDKAPRPVHQGVTENFLVCLETGTRHVLLRRHLSENLGMTPAQYRRRWGLPDDYPMIAGSYLRRRHAIKETAYELRQQISKDCRHR